MLVETYYFGGVINTKTYLNHELGAKFFFLFSLSNLEYKLVNLLALEKISCKMSKNWTLKKSWSGAQLYLWILSLFYVAVPPSDRKILDTLPTLDL